eukprot:15453269-Alexandrium_andersonii.AAC.1
MPAGSDVIFSLPRTSRSMPKESKVSGFSTGTRGPSCSKKMCICKSLTKAAFHRSKQLHLQQQHWLKLRRGLHSIWRRLRPRQAPQGETSLSRAWNRQKAGTRSVATLSARGAVRSAAPPARSAETSGAHFSPIPSPGQGRFALRGLPGPQPQPCGM